VAWTERGQLAGALGRRVRSAAETFEREKCNVIIVSGGRVWNEVVEADAMRDALVRLGVPGKRVLRERCSHTTRGNAQFTSTLLSRLGIEEALLVTCDWHSTRASALFRKCGIRVKGVPARSPPARLRTHVWRWARERVAMRVDGAATTRLASP
jgi:uncharacterized SAM-binding protein YcdF (DUF218 family)